MASIRVVKRKVTGFFHRDDLPTIRNVVKDVHKIMTNASILVRSYCLSKETVPKVNKELIEIACRIVQGHEKSGIRSTENRVQNKIDKLKEKNPSFDDKTFLQNVKNTTDTKSSMFSDMFQVYKQIYSSIDKDINVSTNYSISHILSYSVENLLTAYNNNIEMHFYKYPRRYIICDLIKKGSETKNAKVQASRILSFFMFDEGTITDDELSLYNHLFPLKMEPDKPRCYELKIQPWAYLQKMVEINRCLETDFQEVAEKYRKLLNPLPFHSSFVPMHVRIDTSGLSQLLMTKAKIDDFKNLYSIEHDLKEPLKISNKADLLSSYQKIHGKKADSKYEEGIYATELWSYLTNLKTCKQWKELDTEIKRSKDSKAIKWMFDNSILTDGTSISFQVIDKKCFGRKELYKKKSESLKDVKKTEPTDFSKSKVIGCDPGKKDILTLTDGYRTIRYTKGMREQDTLRRIRTSELLSRRKKSNIEEYETTILNKACKRSCIFDTFVQYIVARKKKEDDLMSFYEKPLFRQFKFLSHCLTKCSEDKFADRIFKTFKDSTTKEKTCTTETMQQNNKTIHSKDDLLIAWGNWGKNPNSLKGCSPTPGIGIRTSFERYYKTTTVNEYLTSQTCPCCRKERSLKNPKINDVERHHLLRCTNDKCHSRWWNRNVVGSFNILFKALECNLLMKPEGPVLRN